MNEKISIRRRFGLLLLAALLIWSRGEAQEKLKVAYSSVDAPNAIWYLAKDKGFYQKHGLDAELIFIPSTTTTVASILAGDVKIGNTSGGAAASAAVAGSGLVMTGCFINTLPYELVVHESIRSAEDLKGKSLGISRVGSASDVAARALLRGLGLEPDKDVAILQVGGSPERAAAFRTGRIAGFPSPPGIIHLAKGIPHRILISTADFPKRFDFPYVCASTIKSYLVSHRDTVRRILMTLIVATHFFKTRKEESKKIMAKYTRQNDEAYLESSYNINAKLYERVPLVTREGVEIQIKDAIARKPGAKLRLEEMVDDSIVVELEKSGYIDRVYR